MKKFVVMLEDLWVAITFAEAGVSETVPMNDHEPRHQDAVCARTV